MRVPMSTWLFIAIPAICVYIFAIYDYRKTIKKIREYKEGVSR